MFKNYDNGTVNDYARAIIDSFLKNHMHENIQANDIPYEALEEARLKGHMFDNESDAKAFIEDNSYFIEKMNEESTDYGLSDDPFEEPSITADIMIDKAVYDLTDKSEFLQNVANFREVDDMPVNTDVLTLNLTTIDRIREELEIEPSYPFQHIDSDMVDDVHYWQREVANARWGLVLDSRCDFLDDCSCSPILDESGGIIGQDIRFSETPDIWLDTSEKIICVYFEGELATFKADPDVCMELTELAEKEFGEEIEEWTSEEKAEYTHSALDVAKGSVDHYFDEGKMVNIERSLDNELESCEEKADVANATLENKELDEEVR